MRRSLLTADAEYLATLTSAAVALALLIQVSWTAQSVAHELGHPYSSSKAEVAYITAHGLVGPQLEVTAYPGEAVLANFPAAVDLTINGGRPTTYWVWSTTGPVISTPQSIVARGSVYVLLAVKDGSGRYPCLDGYRVVTTFGGGLYYKTHVAEGDGAVLLERTTSWTGAEPAKPATCGYVDTGGWINTGEATRGQQ